MKIDWKEVLTKGVGNIFGGIGDAIGKVAGKAVEWVPSPQQYRRNKIRELTKKMLDIQRVIPFDSDKYNRLREQRDRLESEAQNSGV